MGKWTREEEERLMDLYPTTDNREIAAKLGRSVNSIAMKAYKMGLQKKEEERSGEGGSTTVPTPVPVVMLSREEVKKKDDVEVLRVCWSLVEQLRRELENPVLSSRDRLKVMGTLSNVTAVLFNVMRHIEAPEKEDLKKAVDSVMRKYVRGDRFVLVARKETAACGQSA